MQWSSAQDPPFIQRMLQCCTVGAKTHTHTHKSGLQLKLVNTHAGYIHDIGTVKALATLNPRMTEGRKVPAETKSVTKV